MDWKDDPLLTIPHSKTYVEENVSNSHQNPEDVSSSNAISEGEYHVGNNHEISIDGERIYTISREDITFEATLDANVILYSYADCRVVTKLRGWPKALKYLRYYQFCKLDNLITYGSEEKQGQIYLRWLFRDFDKKSKIFVGYVLDKPDNEESDMLFYAQIDETEYNKEGNFTFTDRPSTTYNLDHESRPLWEVDRKQNFILYLVAVGEDYRETPMICWKWGYDCQYNPKTGARHITRTPVEVDLAQFPFPEHLRKLPTANQCQFQFRLPYRGNPAEVIEYPYGYIQKSDEENFNKEMLKLYENGDFNCTFIEDTSA